MGRSRVAWRVVSRVVVLGALVALVASIGAAPVVGEEADQPAATGADVVEVSGEAFGVEAEFDAEVAEDGTLALSELAAAARVGDMAKVRALLDASLAEITATVGVATVSYHDEVGPEPEVELPAAGGGPISDSERDISLVQFGQPFRLAKSADAETQGQVGPEGYAESAASASKLGDGFADEIESECRADLGDLEASTRIDPGGNPLLPKHPEENEVILDVTEEDHNPSDPNQFIRFRFFSIANEQDEDTNAIEVNGYREKLSLEVFDLALSPDPIEFQRSEATVSHSHCDIVPGVVPVLVVEPTFTG